MAAETPREKVLRLFPPAKLLAAAQYLQTATPQTEYFVLIDNQPDHLLLFRGKKLLDTIMESSQKGKAGLGDIRTREEALELGRVMLASGFTTPSGGKSQLCVLPRHVGGLDWDHSAAHPIPAPTPTPTPNPALFSTGCFVVTRE